MLDERHKKPSASGIYRLIACSGSWPAEQDMPELPEQEVTGAGRRIHAALESGDSDELAESESEIASRISALERSGLNGWMLANDIEAAPERIAERRLWMRDRKTLDLVASAQLDVYYVSGDKAYFVDAKTGFNDVPPADKNYQVAVQALCLAHEYPEVVEFTGGIAASRLTSKLDLTIYTRDSLRHVEWEILHAIWKANQPGAPRNPGKHCDYCRAKADCPEAAACSSIVLHNGMVPQLNKLGIAEAVSRMTPMQLAWVWQRSRIAENIFGAISDRLKAMPESQLAAVGLKLKPGAVNRKCTNANEAIAKLSAIIPDKTYECVTVSISKAETAVGEALDIPKKNRREKISEVLSGLIVESKNSSSLQTID